jgi:hypothetical protein
LGGVGEMDHLSTEVDQQQEDQRQPKKEHIEWRRSRVLELSSQGRTEREVATILKVGAATVGRDLSYLNKQARDNLRSHIQERLPTQYLKCQNGLSQVLKMAWNTVNMDSINQTNKLQALSLISDVYKYQLELSINSGVISEAMKFVSRKTEQLNTFHKQGDNDGKKRTIGKEYNYNY